MSDTLDDLWAAYDKATEEGSDLTAALRDALGEALHSMCGPHAIHDAARHKGDAHIILDHPAMVAALAGSEPAGLREAIERDARLQDALDALDLATLWLHRSSDLPHMPSHQAESWERKVRSGRVAIRAALAATPTRPLRGRGITGDKREP